MSDIPLLPEPGVSSSQITHKPHTCIDLTEAFRTGRKLDSPTFADQEPEEEVDIFELAELRRKAAKLPAIEDSNAFLGRPIEKPPVLIDGFLKKKRVMMISASSKMGKTWTLINLAVSVASGQNWLGRNTTSRQGRGATRMLVSH